MRDYARFATYRLQDYDLALRLSGHAHTVYCRVDISQRINASRERPLFCNTPTTGSRKTWVKCPAETCNPPWPISMIADIRCNRCELKFFNFSRRINMLRARVTSRSRGELMRNSRHVLGRKFSVLRGIFGFLFFPNFKFRYYIIINRERYFKIVQIIVTQNRERSSLTFFENFLHINFR